MSKILFIFQGCSFCNCSEASIDSQCDQDTGACVCKPGVSGPQCGRCDAQSWNLGPDGMKFLILHVYFPLTNSSYGFTNL